MAQGDIYKLTVNGALYGARCVNVFNYEVDTDPSSGSANDDILERFEFQVIPNWLDVVSEDYFFDCMECEKVGPGIAIPANLTFPANTVGLVTQDALPPNKCFLISLQSALFSKSGRGRKFFSGVPVTWEDDNAIIASHKAALTALGVDLVASLAGGAGGGEYLPGIYSQVLGVINPVVHSDAHPQVANLRGRTAVRCG